MIVQGTVKLEAPIEKVWSSILDPEKLAKIIPGCEKLKVIDEKTYEIELKVRVGIFRVGFSGTAKITELNEPSLIKIVLEGKDRITGTVINLKATVNLQPISEGENKGGTEITYVNEVNIVGTLANLGETVMRAKSEQIRKEFEANLAELITL